MKNTKTVLGCAVLFGMASGIVLADITNHPHLLAADRHADVATEELRGSIAELQQATGDFGGFRERAIDLVNRAEQDLQQAKEQVHAASDYADRHHE